MKRRFRHLVIDELTPRLGRLAIPFSRVESGAPVGRNRLYRGESGGLTVFLDVIFWDAGEGFSADLLWSRHGGLPTEPATLYPEQAVGAASGSFRVDLLWSNGGNWWTLQPPPPPVMTRRSVKDIFRQAAERVTPEMAREQIPALVDDFVGRLNSDVLPFVAKVRAMGR